MSETGKRGPSIKWNRDAHGFVAACWLLDGFVSLKSVPSWSDVCSKATDNMNRCGRIADLLRLTPDERFQRDTTADGLVRELRRVHESDSTMETPSVWIDSLGMWTIVDGIDPAVYAAVRAAMNGLEQEVRCPCTSH